jgi:peptide/nickel transport system substrate-binding protein
MRLKYLFLLLSLVVVMLLIAACGAQPEESTGAEAETAAEEPAEAEVAEPAATEAVAEEAAVEATEEAMAEEEAATEATEEAMAEAEAATTRGRDGTLTILYWQAASLANPYLAGGTKDIHAGSLVLEPLANYDDTGQLVPTLAQEIPTLENGGVSEDLTSITWKLKEGILWSDGTPLTAADAVFTWEYCTHAETGCAQATFYENVQMVEAVDDLTIKVTFDSPIPYPYNAFVSAQSPILQKAQFENCVGAAAQQCSEQNLMPVGTGPFKIVDFKVNDVVTYQANENYRDPNKPYFAEVIFKGGGDAAAAARAVLETGEADYAWNLQVEPQILSQMEAAGNGKVVAAFATNVERILINYTNPDPALGDQRSEWTEEDPNPHPFLTDPVVQQALSMAVDRNAIATQLYGAAGQPACNILPAPAEYASTANEACLIQDIEGANALLEEAGIVDSDGDGIREKDGVPLRILYSTSTNSVRQKTQELIKQWWSQIGVETELKNVDAAVFFGGDPNSPDTYGKFYTDVLMFTNGASGVDPQVYMSNWLCSEISSSQNNWLGNNVERWCNPEYDTLFEQLTQTPVGPERAEIVKQLNDMVVQPPAANIPLVWRGSVSAHVNSLQGVRMNAWDTEEWNIADWSRTSE